MVIAGAGGHGLEVLEVLLKNGVSKNEILFFDEDPKKSYRFIREIRVVFDMSELKQHFITSNAFYLGVGNPTFRENLFKLLNQVGGMFKPLLADSSFLSHSVIGQFDAMPFSFIGPETKIGKGVLINTRAHVHHECKVGDFTDIGPGAMLLGNSQAGKRCRIGAGAVLLPGIKIGDDVIVGTGAVVTKNFDSGSKIVGIPARILT
jgi:sugar O-acyltransferase (sialic acid O-acetyltransferase NeuD family)